MIGRIGAFNTSEFTFDDILKNMTIMYDSLMLLDDNFIVSGVTIVADMSNVSVKHVAMFGSPVNSKRSALMHQEAYPLRQRTIHLFKMPAFMVATYNLIKSFLKEKNQSKVRD